MKLTEEQIDRITDEIESGMRVFVNKETLEFIPIPDWDDSIGLTEYWEDEQKKIDSEWLDYFVIEKLESWEGFKIMEGFLSEIPDPEMVETLADALSRKRPFAHFKIKIETSHYREKWFEFRRNAYREHVKRQIVAGFGEEEDFESD